ncbi:MAG: class I SAM-dependent methyltransferase [Candidatus Methanoperedens sp.]|nr:class I SAM-dependent methyltransferase [Candidatus Methanoperedens sp.]
MIQGQKKIEKKKVNKEYYDVYFKSNKYIKLADIKSSFQKYRISKILQIYTPNKEESILDLGCGWGTFCFALAPLCKAVIGVDFNQKGIDLCNRLLDKWKSGNIKFLCSDAQNTGLKSNSFDVIICADLFEHLYPDTFGNVLDECNRLLKKGGKLIIWTPHRGHILEILKNNNIILSKEEGHVDYKSMDYLIKNLHNRKFLIKKSYYAESHIPIFCIIERCFLNILPIMRRRIAILAEKLID